MSDLDRIRARIAAILDDLRAHPEKVEEIERRGARDAAFVRAAAASLFARPVVPEQRSYGLPQRQRRKAISNDD